jgi:hypothetical protein
VRVVDVYSARACYGVQDAVNVVIHLVVPKSNDSPTAGFEPDRPPSIRFLERRMLAAIEFDYKSMVGANKIGDE